MFENTPYYLRIFEKNMGFDLEQMELLTNNKTFTSCNKVIFEWLQIYWIGFCSLALLEGQTIMASSWFDELLFLCFFQFLDLRIVFLFPSTILPPAFVNRSFALGISLDQSSHHRALTGDPTQEPCWKKNRSGYPSFHRRVPVLRWFLGWFPEILFSFFFKWIYYVWTWGFSSSNLWNC